MIYDIFLFFNEIDLLKIRLEELKDSINKFVLLEATRTFAYREKPLYFQEYKHEFKEYLDKIVYYLIDDTPVIKNNDRRAIEAYQRNCIYKALQKCNCSENDIILISDVDEIPRAAKIKEAVQLLEENDFVIFAQKFYVYYLNYIHKDAFCGTVACKYSALKKIPRIDDIRWGEGAARLFSTKQRAGITEKYTDKNYPHISNAGWHFTSFGGYDSVLYKAQNYHHAEFDESSDKKLSYIKYNVCRSNVQNNKKFANQYRHFQMKVHPLYRDFVEIPLHSDKDFPIDDALPQYLKINKANYKHFFKFAEPYCDADVRIEFFGKLYSIKCWFLDIIFKFTQSSRYAVKKLLKNRLPYVYFKLKKIKQKIYG